MLSRILNTFWANYSTGFLAVIIVLLSTNAYAQGPVQPEAMQFESVDVTDVVNLATGDFVYTIPVMNVPGPEGDFPIVLSYHSGIGPNQPATWVGLGWTLNPGAINRTISGYPDDYKGDLVVTDYEAEAKSSWGLSLGAGWGPVGVNMSYDHESGKVGVNAMVSVFGAMNAIGGAGTGGIDLGKGFGADLNVSFGTNGTSANASLSGSRALNKGSAYGIGGGLSAGTGGLGIGGGLSKGYGENKAGDGYKGSYSLVSTGASLTSQGLGGNFSVAGTGFSSVTSSSGGDFNAQNFSIKIPLPGDFWVSLGFSKWKWSLDETYEDVSYGVLYQTDNISGTDRTSTIKNERYATDEVLFPSKDAYNVAAQGVSGAFQPFFDYTYELFDKVDNDKRGNLDREYAGNTAATNNIEQTLARFRFLDDTGLNFANKGNLTAFDTEYDFTQILTNEYASKKIVPVTGTESGKIMGFIITMPDGLVYEFLQPIRNIYQYSETDFDDGTDEVTNKNVLMGMFGTSWLLTSIKGSDYVDRGTIGEVDDSDWGYWVKLNYEKVEEPQIWSAPYNLGGGIDYSMGSSIHAKQFSAGIREVYYLESIESKTHKAVFNSGDSENGKNSYIDFSLFESEVDPNITKGESSAFTYTFYGDYTWVEQLASSGEEVFSVLDKFVNLSGVTYFCGSRTFDKNEIDFLYNSQEDITTITVPVVTPCQTGFYNGGSGTILVSNIIDTNGETGKKLNSVALFNKNDLINEISKVSFGYDYSLRPNSPGSTASSAEGEGNGTIRGSLTLKNVSFYGQNDFLVSPPYRFEYAYGGAEGSPYNPAYNVEHYDIWGSYRYTTEDLETQRNVPQKDKGKADLAAAWSMTGIQTPTGSEIDIEYETDDFSRISNLTLFANSNSFLVDESNSTGSTIKVTELFDGPFSDLDLSLYDFIYLNSFPDGTSGDSEANVGLIGIYSIVSTNLAQNEITVDRDVVYQDAANNNFTVFFSNPEIVFGGGSRVKRVSTKNGQELTQSLYLYNDLGGTISSGVTASLPTDFEKLEGDPQLNNSVDLEFFEYLFMDHEDAYGRPNPGVIYSNVQVINVDENFNPVSGMTEYEFFTSYDKPYLPNTSSTHFYIEDRSGIYGKPKAVTYYEQYQENNAIEFRAIKRTENLYAFSDDLFDEANIYEDESTTHTDINQPLGVTQQKHASHIAIDEDGENNDHKRIVERTYFNVFGTGQRVTEFFYDDPLSSAPSSELVAMGKTIGYDMYTGSPIVTAQQAATNSETIVTHTIPAAWIYQGMEDKNMLTQSFQETVYRVPMAIDDENLKDDFATGEVLSSSVSTWANSWPGNANGIWRKNDTYSFVPDATDTFQGFTGNVNYTSNIYPEVDDAFPWKMTSNITQYDEYGHAIETVNEDGTYQSVIYDDDNQSLVLAVASNALLSEIKYENFENGNFTNQPRTGTQATCIQTNDLESLITTPPNDPIHGGDYRVGLWGYPSNQGGVTINGINIPDGSGWTFITFTASKNETISWTEAGCVDDITIIPEYASISYFAYDPLTWKVTAMTGPDHRTSFYEYDDAGRLIGVRDQDQNLIQNNEYVYGQEHYINTDKIHYALGEQVNFDLVELRSGITAVSDYVWDFGDGTGLETTGASASHSYSVGGEYAVSVAFTDSENFTRRSSRTLKIGDKITGDITILRVVDYGIDDSGGSGDGGDGIIVDEPDGSGESYIYVDAIANIQGGIAPYSYEWFLCENTTNEDDCELMVGENSATVQLGTSVTNDGTPTTIYAKVVVTDHVGITYSIYKEAHNLNSVE